MQRAYDIFVICASSDGTCARKCMRTHILIKLFWHEHCSKSFAHEHGIRRTLKTFWIASGSEQSFDCQTCSEWVVSNILSWYFVAHKLGASRNSHHVKCNKNNQSISSFSSFYLLNVSERLGVYDMQIATTVFNKIWTIEQIRIGIIKLSCSYWNWLSKWQLSIRCACRYRRNIHRWFCWLIRMTAHQMR